MKENDIRDNDLVKEILKLAAIDRQKLLNLHEEFVSIPCPACYGNDFNYLFAKDGFKFLECCSCGTWFINPRPTAAMLEDYYKTAESIRFWNERLIPQSENTRREVIFKPRVEKVIDLCRQYGIETNRLVEAGAGFGIFCEEMNKTGFFKEVIAVEPNPELVATCRSKGIKVVEDVIENTKLPEVNVICSFELIEHLFWPEDFIKACANALPSGGIFICTTPNVRGFDMSLLRDKSDNIGGPTHINYFHPDSLKDLLSRCGFQFLEVLTPGKLDAELVRKKVLANELDLDNRPFLNRILVEDWEQLGTAFQQFLADNVLSSHMWMVAQKP
ncbi:MAG: class I SAM-dependent methyltransferase [Syntrophomonas sp.]